MSGKAGIFPEDLAPQQVILEQDRLFYNMLCGVYKYALQYRDNAPPARQMEVDPDGRAHDPATGRGHTHSRQTDAL